MHRWLAENTCAPAGQAGQGRDNTGNGYLATAEKWDEHQPTLRTSTRSSCGISGWNVVGWNVVGRTPHKTAPFR